MVLKVFSNQKDPVIYCAGVLQAGPAQLLCSEVTEEAANDMGVMVQ